MPRPKLILLGCLPLPDKIAQRLGIFIGNPHRGQITGPVAACQLQRVPPISSRGLPASSEPGSAPPPRTDPNCASRQ